MSPEEDRRIDTIAEILERVGLSYVDARRTAKEIARLDRERQRPVVQVVCG